MKRNLRAIRRARLVHGLTVRELAEKLGVSRQAVCDYEAGRYPPIPEVWEKLRRALSLAGSEADYFGRPGHRGAAKLYDENSICKIKGCDRPAIARGVCRKHYQRAWYHSKVNNETLCLGEA